MERLASERVEMKTPATGRFKYLCGDNGTQDKLQLGSGPRSPSGWLNVDGSWSARLARKPIMRDLIASLHLLPRNVVETPWSPDIVVHDLRKPLPFQSARFTAVYASHLLEHLYLAEATQLLRECNRVLRPGGVLRVVVPDLRSIVMEYLAATEPGGGANGLANNADRMNERLLFRPPVPPNGNVVYRIYSALKDFHLHKWMYDAESLISHLQRAGFVEVKQMDFRVSRIPGVDAVEEAARVLDGAGICVEGLKLQAPF